MAKKKPNVPKGKKKRSTDLTEEEIKRFEQDFDVQVTKHDIETNNFEIEYKGRLWRNIKNNTELFCALFDGTSMLRLDGIDIVFVDASWEC